MVLHCHIQRTLTALLVISASQLAVPCMANAKPRAAEEIAAIPVAPDPEPAPAPLPITRAEPPSSDPAKPPPQIYPIGRRLKGSCDNALGYGKFLSQPILIASGGSACSTTDDPFKLVNQCLDSAISKVDKSFPNEVPECRLALIQELWDRCLADNFGLTGDDGVVLPSE